MLIVVSPAKSLDFDTPAKTKKFTTPSFLKESQTLVKDLRKLSPDDISSLMSVSVKLGELNHERFANWHTPFNLENAK
ncbi:MAG: peroxide stress protein YaaA, partial [OM182 bacterium]|nr:peroxide stress protein YaaA [OM182 bacterium]